MASFDPFEKEFRRQAEGLRRTPSGRTWNRLERRLDRKRGTRVRSLQPWMTAALFLLVAGISIIAKVAERPESPLAQRSQYIEELSAPYVPAENFVPVEYEHGVPALDQEIEQQDGFRDVVVAEKYRS